MSLKSQNPNFSLSFRQALEKLKASNLYINAQHSSEDLETLASDIVADTRQLTAGAAFVAYQGVHHDLHDFIEEAGQKNCAFLVLEKEPSKATSTPFIVVKNGRAAWSILAATGWAIGSMDIKFVGVTGTNGKTSVCHIIGELLKASGKKYLTIGTLGAQQNHELEPTTHTTPDPNELYKLIAKSYHDNQTEIVAMEVSSHALAQDKLLPILFDICIFTSFSRDHLDFHANLEDYLNAKLKLFSQQARSDARSILHQDLLGILPDSIKHQAISYGLNTKPSLAEHYQILLQKKAPLSSTVQLWNKKQTLNIPYVGEVGVLNFAAAVLALESLHIELNFSDAKLLGLRPIPGRLEQVSSTHGPAVFVDYCHTPDALEICLKNLKTLGKPHTKIWTVFGCGGDRDQGKRPLMGRIAAEHSDFCVVTSDNPRHEDPQTIIDHICKGMPDASYLKEVDRQKAIDYAIKRASHDDIVLIAGKGHETYQIIGEQTLAFDDRIVAQKALALKTNV